MKNCICLGLQQEGDEVVAVEAEQPRGGGSAVRDLQDRVRRVCGTAYNL